MKKLVNACVTCNGNCWNCHYADDCGYWLEDDSPIPQIEVEVEEGGDDNE